MPRTAAPALVVSSAERAVLERIARSERLALREVIEARGLLMAADGGDVAGRKDAWGVARSGAALASPLRAAAGVGTVRPGQGRKPTLPEGTAAEIVRVTMSERPADGATHWTTRTLAERLGVRRETIRRIWADHGLRPWRVEAFKLSRDPDFEAKLIDVVGLYFDPPERAVVLCVDEKELRLDAPREAQAPA